MTSEYNNLDNTSGKGKVVRKSLGSYYVRTGDGGVVCSISSTLRKHLLYPTADPSSIRPSVVAVRDIRQVDPVAIGDEVAFVDSGDGTGMITDILPRRNKLSRRAAGQKPLEQVIVANVDRAIPVLSAAKPKPKWNLLDRYLVDAEWAEIPALICITKMDLADDDLVDEMRVYEEIGYPVVLTSAVSREGLDELTDALAGQVSVLLGKSGVGKTTLLNAIQPGLGLRVKEVSESTGKGKHTTSHLEMFDLDSGGSVIDTPGMREFGMWAKGDVDLAYLFREMRPFIGECHFGADCGHTHEPHCAIKEAVDDGKVAERRYESYVRMLK